MKCDKKTMLLYAVTDRKWVGKLSLYEQVECALKGGATCIQLRDKQINDEELLNEAIKIKSLCQKYHVPFIINDHVEIAILCHADGIHVGQNDMEVSQVRQLVGEDMIIGVSVHNVEEAKIALNNGADYLGVGAMFTTSTKLDANNVTFETLKNICHSVDIPVVAIGGLNKNNIHMLKHTGVDGVALVSAIFNTDDIENETKQLYNLSLDMVNA